MKSGIYTITSLIDNKILVGQSVCIINRLGQHRYLLRKGIHENKHLQSAYNKYGKDNFLFEVLLYIEPHLLYSEENRWCNLLNTHDPNFGYNLQATTPDGAYRHSEETKLKISLSNKGRKCTEDHCKLMSKIRTGTTLSEETKTRISKGCKGRILSEETKLKMSISKRSRGDTRSKEGSFRTNEGLKNWLKLKLNGKKVIDDYSNIVYDTMTKCITELSISYTAFNRNINGKGKLLTKHKFRYL